MKTEILEQKDVARAAELLKAGEVVCFPTETVYGAGAICTSEAAFKKLVAVKRRPSDKPFTLMCSSIEQALHYCHVDFKGLAVMKAYMPGEITILAKAAPGLDQWVTLGTPVIGIRIPDSQFVLDMINRVGVPLLVPSANHSGEPTSTTFEETFKVFDGEVAAVVKGNCTAKLASTIVNVSNVNEIKLVREGPVPFEDLKKVWAGAKLAVSLGCDHGGFTMKEAIKAHLIAEGYTVLDEGAFSTERVDYPVFGKKAAIDVVKGKAQFGVLVCTTGEGISIAANKVQGIRCGIGYDDGVSEKMREHNNCNMIAFGQAHMAVEDVLKRVDIFLETPFVDHDRHERRVAEIMEIEKGC
ncbi:MAG: Ribose-5-phosphate isomerase B [Tenericutes bacterium ADurb.BinA155]|jgi:L-threonylcarbamoyladenylate synthase|nr:MAG: Ribose-5-phosphate isomerase B [Tenericutes bacterium ADurb.BinA155]